MIGRLERREWEGETTREKTGRHLRGKDIGGKKNKKGKKREEQRRKKNGIVLSENL